MMISQVPEQSLYSDGQVSVTTARFVVGSTLYPVRGLTAVQPIVIPPNRNPAVWCGLAALVAFTFAGLTTSDRALAGAFALGGACAALLALALWSMAKPTYVVRVWTAGGQVDAVHSEDPSRIQQIVAALHRATMGG